ncbi:histidine phosphatase family protein [Caulobacter vibrioides]|uniref:SixA phosphatase family protein n=1 Tax=Caulobacter vibrioides TaxID=155892 RepID=UPI000BB4E9CC|nr:histidine phosphatase family protein [Caulobacter vibrioides]ATC23533.1 histidine phosphatase family protein [Caulobacter vibrioides]AZH11753.1 histidine phosphatase family protein [Caulobacter vibrioides]PLR11878.1 histidine phosphatase family protein [Caulobacter vibrioides]
MERLILMRHGKAERHAQSGGDFERALAESGRADASLMGRVLAGLAYEPDLFLVSSARRTRETAEQVAAHFSKARVEHLRDLYHADPEEILQAVEDAVDAAGTVMVVGHNPGMHELALRLAVQAGASPIQSNKLRSRFPTSTVVVLAWDGTQTPRLEHLLYVNENGGMGGE